MANNPIIGLTSSRNVLGGKLFAGLPRVYLNEDYTQAIESVNGTPIVLPPTISDILLNQYIDMCDGLLVTGGLDIHPLLYKASPKHECNDFDKMVDESHIKLIQLALKANKPVLGICRGAQLLNIACGGNLYQDIKKEIPNSDGHLFTFLRSDEIHNINIEANTILHSVFASSITVNSVHHQSVKDLGEGLIITARSADGVVEGIEMPDRKFVLGVQWHPEMMLTKSDSMKCLFEEFIKHAK